MSKTVKYSVFALVILFLLISKYHSIFYHFFDWDEAQIMSMSWAMTHGIELYTEMPEIHPVFHFFIFYPFFLLFDPDTAPHAIRIFNILYIGGVTFTLMAIVFQWVRCYWTSFFAGILMIFYFGYYGWALCSYGEFYTLLPVLYSLLLMIRNTVISRRMAVFIGLLWGIAFFIKQVALFDAIGIICIFLIINKQNINKIKILVFFFCGFMIAVLIAFLYPLFHSSVNISFDSMILSSVISYSTKNSNGLLNTSELFFRFYLIFKRMIFQISGQSQMFLVGLCFLVFLSLLNRFIHADRKKTKEISLFYGYLFWFVFLIFGISLIGRYYSHYAIQILPPFIMLLCFFIKGLPEGSRKTLIALVSLGLMTLIFFQFWKDTKENGFYYIPEKVRHSLEIADAVKQFSKPEEKIFLLWHESLDVFYLSQRLSNNGIYMFILMDSKHTNDVRLENERKSLFLKEMPQLIISEDYYPIDPLTSIQKFFNKIILEKYRVVKEVGKTKIHSRI